MIFCKKSKQKLLMASIFLFVICIYVPMIILNNKAHLMSSRGGRHAFNSFNTFNLKAHRFYYGNETHNYYTQHEERTIVFIKIMKCASTSISQLMLRFAYKRDLQIVFPLNNKIYIGWPYPPKLTYISNPTEVQLYHISCHHVIYDRHFFDSIMMPNAKYITSLRQPYTQFKSMVNYFNVLNISKVPYFTNRSERFKHFMYNLEYYDKVYKLPNSSQYRYCVPNNFSMTKNLMSSSLGFSQLCGFDINLPISDKIQKLYDEKNVGIEMYTMREKMEKSLFQGHVDRWLRKLDKEMDLVLIVEWLPESLALMRRMFRWTMEDILLLNSNALSYDFKYTGESKDRTMKIIYRSWSWIDHDLYNHFNKSLWNRLNSQPASFWDEVARLKEILLKITQFCSKKQENLKLTIEKSSWNNEFEVRSDLCIPTDEYINLLKSRYKSTLRKQNIDSIRLRDLKDFKFC